MSNALTPTEIGELERLEAVIESGEEVFLRTGGALIAIRDRKLYRRGYETFENYCQKRWKFSPRRALQLINSTIVAKALTQESGTMVPLLMNERQARELAKVPAEKRAAVLDQASSGGQPTAKKIAEAAALRCRSLKVEKPAAIVDFFGYPVPEELHDLWARRDEAEVMGREIAGIRNRLLKLQADKDPLWGLVSYGETIERLGAIHQAIGNVRLYAVCGFCNGRAYKTCKACGFRGIMSKFQWTTVLSEVKAMREAMKARRA